jgi:NDP-sugar pyrophosphorylase family protein
MLVLAGGYGSRLRDVVTDVPKPMAPIGPTPFLKLQIDNWHAQGLRDFTFLLHHRADQIIDFLEVMAADAELGCQFNWLFESTPMDTGGAIANAVKEFDLQHDFLIANADTWLSGGVRELMDSRSPAIAVVDLPDVSRYGRVYFNELGYITSFEEKNSLISSGWINAGLYRLSASLFRNWSGQPFSLERELFMQLAENLSLTAVPIQTDFIDIGVPDDYYRFCDWFKSSRQK